MTCPRCKPGHLCQEHQLQLLRSKVKTHPPCQVTTCTSAGDHEGTIIASAYDDDEKLGTYVVTVPVCEEHLGECLGGK